MKKKNADNWHIRQQKVDLQFDESALTNLFASERDFLAHIRFLLCYLNSKQETKGDLPPKMENQKI